MGLNVVNSGKPNNKASHQPIAHGLLLNLPYYSEQLYSPFKLVLENCPVKD